VSSRAVADDSQALRAFSVHSVYSVVKSANNFRVFSVFRGSIRRPLKNRTSRGEMRGRARDPTPPMHRF